MTAQLKLRVCSVLAVLAVSASRLTGQGVESRHHFGVSSDVSGMSYRMTKIFQMPNETETRSIYLLEDENGDRLMLTDTRDYFEQTNTYEISDLSTKEVVRATVKFPFKSVTRSETLIEQRGLKDDDPSADFPVSIEVNGVTAAARESEWLTEAVRARRSALRRAATSQFLERLERLRPILGAASELHAFCAALLRFVLYGEGCSGTSRMLPAQPDCQFDSSFRYPCSDRQKERVQRARERNKILPAY